MAGPLGLADWAVFQQMDLGFLLPLVQSGGLKRSWQDWAQLRNELGLMRFEGLSGLAQPCAWNAKAGEGAPHLVGHLGLEGTQPRWAHVRRTLGRIHGLDRGY
ncbi:hypothetical protein Adt_49301 [Abeliophyllum distichum]|uniref:Uncharacterized protein n=1 Tax=Abeliophyllum distichum TaxID=126358 RepID=A0ABD1NNK6_9LAMI